VVAVARIGLGDHDGSRGLLERRFDMVELLFSKGARPNSSPPSPK
jgi:hypothetical protein